MNVQTTIRVRVLHADPVISAGLAAVLRDQVNVDLETTTPRPTQDFDGVDVIVSDYRNGIAAISALKTPQVGRAVSTTKVLIVSDVDREWEVRSAISAGVRGYVLQGCPIDELVEGVMNVSQGQRYLSQSVARRIADSMSREELTAREAEVLHLLTTGSCNKSIARDLGIAVGTVKVHVKGILEKLGAASRTHAVAVAGELGLVSRVAPPSHGVSRAALHDLMAASAASRPSYGMHA